MGVASLVAMLSLGVGLQELASTRLSRSGLFDAVFVTTQANMRAFGGPPRPAAERTSTQPARKLDDDARQQLAQIKNVVEVYPEVRFPTEVQFEGKPYMTTVAGIPASARRDGAFDEMKGTFFSGPEANEAILQIEFARDLIEADGFADRQGIWCCVTQRRNRCQRMTPPENAAPKSAANRSDADDAPSIRWILARSAGIEAAHHRRRGNRAGHRLRRLRSWALADPVADRAEFAYRAAHGHARNAPRQHGKAKL